MVWLKDSSSWLDALDAFIMFGVICCLSFFFFSVNILKQTLYFLWVLLYEGGDSVIPVYEDDGDDVYNFWFSLLEQHVTDNME